MLLLLLLPACPVEMLGIELPEGGEAAISMDDVQRDTQGLLRGDEAARRAFFTRRLGEMGLTAFDAGAWTCGRRRGEGGALYVAPAPLGADTAAAGAALISVLKAWDTSGGPPGPVTACLAGAGDPAPTHTTRLDLGPFAPGALRWSPAGDGVDAGVADPSRPVEAIDFRLLRDQAKELFRGVQAARG